MINTSKLRVFVGIAGMLLPVFVLLLSVAFGYPIPDSISATYYNDTCVAPFMIILGSAGTLLLFYQGYDKQDDIICTLAGIAGFMICLFPCQMDNLSGPVGTFHIPIEISGIIHNLSAVVFFLLLAYNSLFLFTKCGPIVTEKKLKRNIIFKVCGIGMMISLALIVPVSIFNIATGTWWVELVALFFFGISWLTKANVVPFLFSEK